MPCFAVEEMDEVNPRMESFDLALVIGERDRPGVGLGGGVVNVNCMSGRAGGQGGAHPAWHVHRGLRAHQMLLPHRSAAMCHVSQTAFS